VSSVREDNFVAMVKELDTLVKQYEKGQIKYHQKTDQTDRVFEKYAIPRSEFFKEVNAKLGIQMHSASKPTKKIPKKKQAVADPPPLNEEEKIIFCSSGRITAMKAYRSRTGATLYGARIICDQYENSLG
jgi:hypothetical protein